MTILRCRTARRWLQAPETLSPLDSRYLDRHLEVCNACAQFLLQQVATDRLIGQHISTVAGAASVRGAVLEQIHAQEAQRSPRGARPFRVTAPRRRWTPLLIIPLAVAAALLLLILPGAISRNQGATPTGAAWKVQRITIGFPLAVDPGRSDHLLAGAWQRVYESWDAGANWHPLTPLGRYRGVIRDLTVDAAHPSHYLVATQHSIIASNDAGRHWYRAAADMLGAENMFVTQSPARGTFYAGPSVLWRSADGGHTWSRYGDGRVFAPNGIQALAFASEGRLITGVWGNGVAVSADGGRTWQQRSRGLAPHVMNVHVGPHGWWAATDRGTYHSNNDGVTWRRVGPIPHFFNTDVLDGGRYLLAGGSGAVYRSTDGGASWQPSVNGLPLDPYVYGFIADPRRPQRVYVSLDGDGLFRSDDGGRHWHAIRTGMPISGNDAAPLPILFGRHGDLWIANAHGTDPGNLTAGERVTRAAVSPDGAAVTYVAATADGWAARLMGAGGSAPRTVASGSGPFPTSIRWSPNASLLAFSEGNAVTVSNLSGHGHHWLTGVPEQSLGWTGDGRSLLFWDQALQRVLSRSWATGKISEVLPGSYPAAPLPAPDEHTLALIAGRTLLVGGWNGTARVVARIDPSCRLRSWSADSTRLLLACGTMLEQRAVDGHLVRRIAGVPIGATWVPGSDTDLLFFRHGSLRRWSPRRGGIVIVQHAQSVPSTT